MNRFLDFLEFLSPLDIPGIGSTRITGDGNISVSDLDDETPVDDKDDKEDDDGLIEIPDDSTPDDEDEVLEEDEEKEDEDKEESKDNKKKSKKEEPEDEPEEDTELKEDKLLVPPKRKEILAKYPKLFEEFPYVEHAMYQARAYQDLFGTVEEAKEVHEKAQALDNFEADLMKGEISRVLESIKETDKKTFHKMVDNYLVNLKKVDSDSYQHVMSNVYKNTIAAMVTEGNRRGNDALKAAAELLHQFIFGNTEWTPPKNLVEVDDDPKSKEVENERAQFMREKFEDARDELSSRVDTNIKSIVDVNIDKNNQLTPYLKKTATKEAVAEVYELLSKDKQFTRVLTRLWQDAHKNKYDKSSREKIRSAYMQRAKQILPNVIKKHRSEALKGAGRRVNDKEKDDVKESVSDNSPRGGRPSRGESKGTVKERAKTIPAGVSSAEYLLSGD